MSKNNFNRRAALKRIGAASVTVPLISSTATAATDHLSIHIYPNYYDEEYEAQNHIKPALEDFCGQLEQENIINDWTVWARDYNTNISTNDDSCFRGDYFDKFIGSAQNCDIALGVIGNSKIGNAQSLYGKKSAWRADEPRYAWVGVKGGYSGVDNDEERYNNVAIQECSHLLMKTQEDEHAFGKIMNGLSSPMITLRENKANNCVAGSLNGEGDCHGNSSWNYEHRTNLTDCTIQAIGDTKEGNE